MEMPLHQLRRMSPGIGRFLLPILLLSWLTAFCTSCFAAAEAAALGSESVPPCHAPAKDTAEHDCCESNLQCSGNDCVQAESAAPPPQMALLEVPSFDLPVPPCGQPDPGLSKPPPTAALPGPLVPATPVPIYLRCCRFLN